MKSQKKSGRFSEFFPLVAWALIFTLFFPPSMGISLAGGGGGYFSITLQDKQQYSEPADERDMWWDYDPASGSFHSDFDNNPGSSNFDPMDMALSRGISQGSRLVNAAGEAFFASLTDRGRIRLNFSFDKDGYFNGEGDLLFPFYDGKYTTIYTQIGARSMHDSSDTRWIGNLGLGQRWFPKATGEFDAMDYDAGKLMLGYNLFFDYDFTRNHQRGGVGAELWYDWLRLGLNYYFPISDWKNSEDFDSRLVSERAAEGWDARVKAYLPFYRHVALTGSYSQWFGDRVGIFGADDLEKDPHLWTYGIEYTPIPLISGFVTQKSTERGKTDTEFGINLTYHFGMPWKEQIRPAKVAELRTAGGSRHEFVDRENRIILEYKAKNAFMIEYLGPKAGGENEFIFRIRNGFDEFKAGETVRVTASGVTLAAAPVSEKSFFARAGSAILDFFSPAPAHAADFSQVYTTDRNGQCIVKVDSPFSGMLTLHVQAGNSSQSFTVNVVDTGTYALVAKGVIGAGSSTSFTSSQTVEITVELQQNNAAYTTATEVVWNIVSADNRTNKAVISAYATKVTGLAWGDSATLSPGTEMTDTATSTTSTSTGEASIQLTDIMGERTVIVQASVTISGKSYTNTQTVIFGKGPLAKFRLPTGYENNDPPLSKWADAHISAATELPAAALCGKTPTGYASWAAEDSGDYSSQTGLPTQTELRTVATWSGNGAWNAAGWPDDFYWTGELFTVAIVRVVYTGLDSPVIYGQVDYSYRVVCRR